MKKLKLLIFMGLLIISCTSHENDIQKKKLIKLEQRQFHNGELTETIIFEYNNQKPLSNSFFDRNGKLTYSSEHEYFINGYLSNTKGYLPNRILNSETSIIYDDSMRIVKTINYQENSTYIRTTNFTYNNNNTITSITNSNGDISSKLFEINSNGFIDNEFINGNIVTSLIYENRKIISKTSNSTLYNYTYLDKGYFPFQSIYDNNLNIVLLQNNLDNSSESITTELIKKIESSNTIIEYTYTFDEDNYPLIKKEFYNGKLSNEFYYSYEEQL